MPKAYALSSNGKTVRQTFSIPVGTFERLETAAEIEERSLSWFISKALEAYLADFTPKAPGE